MKNYKKIMIPIFTFGLLSFSSVFAWGIDHFEVELEPNETNIWEAIDLTIQAVDKNNVIVTDYNWTIVIFSESDPEAELPSAFEDNIYEFSLSDQWEIKFENWVVFKNSWTQDLYIYDLDDDTVMWIWEVEVSESITPTIVDIEILSPESWITIWVNQIEISWSSQKNHNINIILNGKSTYTTSTDNEWIFEYTVKWLLTWENTIKAEIIDSDDNVIWESNEIEISVDSSEPELKSLNIEKDEVEVESSFEIEAITNNITTEVSVVINEVLTSLNKDETGKFSNYIYAPSEAWNYSIDIILKDELWHELQELWAGNIVIVEPELNLVEVISSMATEEEEVVEELNVPQDLTIKWLNLVELKSKSILTWDEIEWVIWYNIYKKLEDWTYEFIEEVNEAKFEIEISWDEIKYDYFAIKAITLNDEWTIYEWDLSEATKIQTWPEMLILLIISMMVWLFVFVTKKKKA